MRAGSIAFPLVFGILALLLYPEWFQLQPSLYRGYLFVDKSIERVEWTPSKPFAKEISSHRKPLILNNTIAEEWPARKLWTPQFVSSLIKRNVIVNSNCHPVFVYFDKKKPMAALAEVEWKAPSKEISVSAQEFLRNATKLDRRRIEGAASSDDMEYLYFSASFEGFPELNEYIEPRSEWLNVGPESDLKPERTLWMGAGGVTAQTHYDSLHNIFVQIYGHKTFILSPPEAYESLYLYPSAHPSARQSQVDFIKPDVSKFANFGNIPAFKVTLGPGDVLYLPPFWFHRVIAEDLSISVSTWTDSEETKIYYDSIQTLALPFESDWTKEEFAVGLKRYIEDIAEEIEKYDAIARSPKYLLKSLVEQRYVPIFGNRSKDEHACLLRSAVVEDLSEKFKSRAKQVASFFEQIRSVGSVGARDILFHNFVEMIVGYFLPIEQVNKFMQSCLT